MYIVVDGKRVGIDPFVRSLLVSSGIENSSNSSSSFFVLFWKIESLDVISRKLFSNEISFDLFRKYIFL